MIVDSETVQQATGRDLSESKTYQLIKGRRGDLEKSVEVIGAVC